jgi:hypothetical protein
VAAILRKAYAMPKETLALIKSILGDKTGIATCSDCTAAARCQKRKRKKKKKKARSPSSGKGSQSHGAVPAGPPRGLPASAGV